MLWSVLLTEVGFILAIALGLTPLWWFATARRSQS